ncbi:sugar-binding transcriptional regulator [Cohaesibacter gelatinilyticus]|uniref:DNA-binding transcriptional regulator LsrR, DeoR family n=1 Tax=Cohaesibacter gelatinilyticus TaxID=372072 RepID=A0A285PFC2_9HYPH|nr:sugar-binding transcriptional regulator [Cohaesibacter gelatinilyticus]SNZ20415.1 DNA-binding transcriptional regulator LsrR, DeoR family [Cohaesibacter gelatinilyticus]
MANVVRRRAAGQISGEDIVVEAAWMYYHDAMNQSEIAKKLQVSRATVVNYLQEAREKGIIRISLSDDAFTGHRAALALTQKLGLKAAYVLPNGAGNQEQAFMRVALGAAEWLPDLLKQGDRLGVAWGRTIYEMAEAMEQHEMDDLVVSQLVGSMATPYGFTAEICSAHLARALGAKCINLHAPAVLTDPDLAARLRQEPLIQSQLDALSHCNKSVFAAGSCQSDSHIVSSGVASQEDLDWYKAEGATGVICGRFINAQGEAIPGPLDERMIGVTLDRLKNLEMGLLVSDGLDKVEAMNACIKGGYVTHVVTSADTAQAMLDTAD